MADYTVELRYKQNSKDTIAESVMKNYGVSKPTIGTATTAWVKALDTALVLGPDAFIVYSNYDTEPHSVTITSSTPPLSPDGNETPLHVVLAGTQRTFTVNAGESVWVKTLAGTGGTPP